MFTSQKSHNVGSEELISFIYLRIPLRALLSYLGSWNVSFRSQPPFYFLHHAFQSHFPRQIFSAQLRRGISMTADLGQDADH